jgi:hypothetical protein
MTEPHVQQPDFKEVFPMARTTALNRLRGTSTMTVVCILAAGVLIFLLVGIVLLREPLSNFSRTKLVQTEQRAAAEEQNAQYMALEKAVDYKLAQATDALDKLQTANDLMTRRVEAIVGQSWQSAVNDPPSGLARAMLKSDDLLHAWTNLLNTRVTPEQIAARKDTLSTLATCLHQKTLQEHHQYQVEQVLEWATTSQKSIEAIDLGFLKQDTLVDHNQVPLPTDKPIGR